MGIAKSMAQQRDDQYQYVLGILLEAHALEECEHHPGTYLEGDEDLDGAYKLANAQWSRGKHQGVFKSMSEMTDAIKSAHADNAADECSSCAKWRDE